MCLALPRWAPAAPDEILEELIIAPGAQSDVQDKLHLGVFSGSLQLEHLQIRRDALTSLGASHHDP